MRHSIRTFLLINLLLSVTLIISLAIIGNLFLAHKDIQVQLDAQLINTTLHLKSFFSDFDEDKRDLAAIQRSLYTPLNVTLHNYPNILHPRSELQAIEAIAVKQTENTLEFQIWNKDGKLILHSPKAPKIPLSNGKDGLSNLWIDNNAWRVNTLFDPNNQLTYMVAERTDYRQTLENKLTKDSIFIMLITYPFLGLLIWVIVGKGLDTLKRVANEVSHRAPSYLKPVDLTAVPPEIAPLIKELNSLFNRLQDAFDREKRFTADAAHELRTPLAALNTFTQIAIRAETPEERKDALLKILAGVNRSTHVVQQLLTLNRMTPEALKTKATQFNLAREAADIAAELAPEAIAKKIELELICEVDEPLMTGHPTAIGILLRNLIDNAIRYSPEKSTVTIKIERHDDRLILRVIDNGPGIPDELKERVFERFFRILGNKATGSGLGLGIVLQIAKIHHGDIKLEKPESGQGLDFQIWFPS
jgi:two-component system sensor histidine kinase QseC